MVENMEDSPRYPVLERVQNGAYCTSLEQYQELYQQSIQNPEAFWAEQAKRLTWFHPWEQVLHWDFHQAQMGWFLGGKLNVSYNCVDRHLQEKAEQTAILWEADNPQDSRAITYGELHHEVCRIANVLTAHGIRKGDRVCLYMPMIPELAYSMLACARIGAIHSIIFAGFSSEAIRDRVLDCGASLVFTANEGLRGGRVLHLKTIVDQALEGLTQVKTVLVARRTPTRTPMQVGRDFWLEDECAKHRGIAPAPWMDAEDPLFILYTSGSTGKPKGALHTTGGYLLYASLTHHYVFDYRPGDIYCCAADIGWITGHSYIVYGPLANGATTVLFESTPTYPDAGRYWEMVQRYRINTFYTAPTAIRAIAREGEEFVKKYDRSSLRILGTVGEPINPSAWEWYYHTVGEARCAIVDTWWQTETGGILISPLPGATPLKPGSATLPFFGVQPALVNTEGKELTENEVSGLLCLKYPWPGMARSVYGDHQRFYQTYYQPFPGKYFTGDGCRRDKDGYYWITGRVDDVLNVAGHRLGTAEIESSLNANSYVAESAVVGIPHEIKGETIFAYVVLKKGVEAEQTPEEILKALQQQVSRDIGSFAKPEYVQIAPGLPKTRSGKIMRRILRKISHKAYQDLGNITALADPSVVEKLIEGHQALFP